jgi:hypothetical protein
MGYGGTIIKQRISLPRVTCLPLWDIIYIVFLQAYVVSKNDPTKGLCIVSYSMIFLLWVIYEKTGHFV